MSATRETFQEIYDYVLDKLGITDSDMGSYTREKVCKEINNAQHRIALMLAQRGDQFLVTSSTISTVANQEIYSIGSGGDFDVTNHLRVKQLLVIDFSTSAEKPLTEINVSERYKHILTGSTTTATEALDVTYYYFTTKAASSSSEVMYPAIGLVPCPGSAWTNALKMYYFFKPRPLTYSDDSLTNGGQAVDIPENTIPYFKTLATKALLEQDWSEEKIRVLSAREAEERNEATEVVGQQSEDSYSWVDYEPDPSVDY